MTTKQFWEKIDKLASQPCSVARDMEFMVMLKQAYEENLGVIIGCFSKPGYPDMVFQSYMEVDGMRFMMCYTSKMHANNEWRGGKWEQVQLRDIMNNMFNKSVIGGLVFNPENENMVIVPKELCQEFMPGEKPLPPFYRPAGSR